jgi:Spy/CpxP family protein refolding chaperone
MKMLRISALGAALVLAVAPMANAQAGGGRGGNGGGRGGARMTEMLFKGIDLTDTEKAAIDSIQTAYRAKMPARTPGQAPDPAARAAMRETMQKETADLRSVLTPDQQKVFDKNVEEMRSRQRNRSGN